MPVGPNIPKKRPIPPNAPRRKLKLERGQRRRGIEPNLRSTPRYLEASRQDKSKPDHQKEKVTYATRP